MVEELLHIVGGFLLGSGVYQYFGTKNVEKPNTLMLFVAGFAGYLFVEFVLHEGV